MYIHIYVWQLTSRTNAYAYSYITQACGLYNHLPDNINSSVSLAHFKIVLKAHLL